jgi:hypothetical protein
VYRTSSDHTSNQIAEKCVWVGAGGGSGDGLPLVLLLDYVTARTWFRMKVSCFSRCGWGTGIVVIVCGNKWMEVTRRWRKFHGDNLHNLCPLHRISSGRTTCSMLVNLSKYFILYFMDYTLASGTMILFDILAELLERGVRQFFTN